MKTNIILAIILLVVSAAFLITQPAPTKLTPDTEKSFMPLLERFDYTEVSTIKISHKSQSVTLFRTKDITELTGAQASGDWVIEDAMGHAAKVGAVDEFLLHLKELKRGFVRAADITNLKDYNLVPEEAVIIELFKTEKKQVENEKKNEQIKIQIKRIPYYTIMIGKSPATKELMGMNNRFIRLGVPKDPLPDVKFDSDTTEMFDFDSEVLFVKDVNMSKISSDLNNWLNLELFRLNDWLENVDEVQMIKIFNFDDDNRKINLAEREKLEEDKVKDTTQTNDNSVAETEKKEQLGWYFLKVIEGADNKKQTIPDILADDTKIKNFLYDLRSFKVMSYRDVIDLDSLNNPDYAGKGIVQGILVKKISDQLQLKISDMYQEKNNIQQRLYYAEDMNEAQLMQKRIKELESEISKYLGGKQLLFYIFEEDVDGKPEYWLILESNRFSRDKKSYFWQYNISEEQMKKLSPEKTFFQIQKDETETPSSEDDDPNDAGLQEKPTDPEETEKPDETEKPAESAVEVKIIEAPENPWVRMKTSMGDMIIELYEDDAPNTVANFMELVEKKFYDNIYFHRIIKNFMIQGGCPNSRGSVGMASGMGDPGYKFADEFSSKHKFDKKGLLAMANSGPNTNGSQFFITHAATPWLTGKHTIFGHVVSGMDILEKIATTPVRKQNIDQKPKDSPLEDVYIISVEVIQKRDHEYKVKTMK